MDAEYPEGACRPESRRRGMRGEGPFALWHFSEVPSLGRFRPEAPAAHPDRFG